VTTTAARCAKPKASRAASYTTWWGTTFATVRHPTVRPKDALSRKTGKRIVFKLFQAAAEAWRRLKGAN
jgi:hypothetical protein